MGVHTENEEDDDDVPPKQWGSCVQEWRYRVSFWKESTTLTEWHHLFEHDMVQWSPLLKLPYWDPGKFLVVDPMHNLSLGLAASHVQKVLLMFWEATGKTTQSAGKPIPVGNVTEEKLARVVEVVNGFESGGVNTPEEKVTWLQEYNFRTLIWLCNKLDKPFPEGLFEARNKLSNMQECLL